MDSKNVLLKVENFTNMSKCTGPSFLINLYRGHKIVFLLHGHCLVPHSSIKGFLNYMVPLETTDGWQETMSYTIFILGPLKQQTSQDTFKQIELQANAGGKPYNSGGKCCFKRLFISFWCWLMMIVVCKWYSLVKCQNAIFGYVETLNKQRLTSKVVSL